MSDDIRDIFYVCKHDGFLGAGDKGRTKCTVNMLSTLSVAFKGLTGQELGYSRVPVTLTVLKRGYQVHLSALQIAFRKMVTGQLSDVNRAWLYRRVRYNKRNAVILTTWGDTERAGETLMDERLFPPNRLPTAADRCEPWLWQREESEWTSCKGGQHRGGDFLFAAQLLLGE